jgi:RNA polymerase sigma-70 factor (ECF subfamily)
MATLTLLAGNGLEWRSGWSIDRPAGSPAASKRPACAFDRPAKTEPGLDDAAWIARVQQGDEDAARALVERLYPTIIKVIRCHLPRRTSEEDLAQAVYGKIFRNLHQFSGRVPLEHWVSRITVNTCINQLNHENVRPELRMCDLSEEQEAVIEHLACTNDELPGDRSTAARELLEKLLAQLKPDERLVITLLHLEERSTAEVSRLTGWSVSLVKVRAFRARHKLRKIWDRLFKDKES